MLKIKNIDKDRDTCHYSGEYNCVEHSICNLRK